MSETDWDASIVRAFLLAQLPEEQRGQLLRALASDPEYAQFFAAVEDELVMDYMRHRLTPEDQQRFELHYQSSEERAAKIRFARALVESFSRENRLHKQRLAWVYALVALVGIALPSIWVVRARTVTAELYPGIYRDAQQAQTVWIGPLTTVIRLRLRCSHSFAHAPARLSPVGANHTILTAVVEAPDRVAIWQVPAALLPPGEYLVQVGQDVAFGDSFLLLIEK